MQTKDEAARKLAEAHYSVEPGISQIFRITGSADLESTPNEPIKLLEVNEDTIASGIMPLNFDAAPAHGIEYPSVIVEVTPEELKQIQTKKLQLPAGWTLNQLLPKPPESDGE